MSDKVPWWLHEPYRCGMCLRDIADGDHTKCWLPFDELPAAMVFRGWVHCPRINSGTRGAVTIVDYVFFRRMPVMLKDALEDWVRRGGDDAGDRFRAALAVAALFSGDALIRALDQMLAS